MQTLRNALLISAGVIAIAGFVGEAMAQDKIGQSRNTHVLIVRLPDGSREQIRYTGDQPPEVNIRPTMAGALMPIFDDFGPGSPFADMERISAAMDREAAAMLEEASRVEPDNVMNIDFGKLPPGTQGYTVVSTMSGNQSCTRSERYVISANGKPRVETSTSGSCGVEHSRTQPLHVRAPSPRPVATPPQSGVIEAAYQPKPTVSRPSAGSMKIASALGN